MLELCRNHSDHQNGLLYLYQRALEKAYSLPPDLPFLEIGTRAGGSALLFLKAIKESGIPRPLITVDPYGKPYKSGPEEYLIPGEGGNLIGYPPTGEEHYQNAMSLLSSFSKENRLTYIHYRMESRIFFEIWNQGALWIEGNSFREKKLGLIYLDGEHTEEAVFQELSWSLNYLHPQGLIIIDDVQHIRNSRHPLIQKIFKEGIEENLRLYFSPFENKSSSNGSSPRYALVTIACGEDYQRIAKLTHPSLKAYADKIGADFIVINENTCSTPHWMKFEIFNLLNLYSRIIYIDSDAIIRENCDDLFKIVPEDSLGLFDEAPYTPDRRIALRDICIEYGFRVEDYDGAYYNTGVMVLSQKHQHLFCKPEKEIFNFYEQSYLNAIFAIEKPKIHKLSYRFNRMSCIDPINGEERHASYICHYAGWQSLREVLSLIRGDLTRWKELKEKNYPAIHHILIAVHGGLGDQIQAEPAIRFALEKVWTGKSYQVEITTHWPQLFQHIERDFNTPVFHHKDWVPLPQTPYRRFNTLPGPETAMWGMVSNLLCHTIDYCSIALLRRILPVEDKQVHLEVLPEDLERAKEIVGDPTDLILVHAGLHWENKSFPQDWWQEVVDRLVEADLKVCLIGEDDETRGVYNLKCPSEAIDTRNKLTLGEFIALISQSSLVISNDSSPIHIAGAFDTGILLIPTCKHPSHLLPWRNGSQEWKTCALRKQDMSYDFISDPTEIEPPKELNGEFIPPGKNWEDYLPSPEEIVENTLKMVASPRSPKTFGALVQEVPIM